MNDVNLVIIHGAIQDAGAVQEYERGKKRTLRLRSLREYRQKDYETWVDVSLWGDLSQIPWLAAGIRVAVTGRLSSESWTTQAGEKKSKLVIAASTIEMLAPPMRQTQYAPPPSYGQYHQQYQAQYVNHGGFDPLAQDARYGGTEPPKNTLPPPQGVPNIPSPGCSSAGAASSSNQADVNQPDLPF